MLGRKSYMREEIDAARATVQRQQAAFAALSDAVAASGDVKAQAALEAFDGPFFDDLVLALDRPFVHRLRGTTGKDGSPLNELELLVDSLIGNDGVLRGINVIAYVPEESVTHLHIGDRIQLSRRDFERLAHGVFAELEEKFLS